MRASGRAPRACARSAEATTSAAAPSLMPLALPAVTVPSLLEGGLQLRERLGGGAGARILVGVERSSASPFFCGTGTATISSLKLPAAIAAAARAWLCAANASCAARVTWYLSATFSAVMPMWMSANASVSPSWSMWSSTSPWPSRWPQRAPGSRYGAPLMLSVPPATTTSASPALIACAASITALRPEPQTLLTVCAGTDFGMPAVIAAWRAGFMPSPACRMQPRITSSTCVRRDAGAAHRLGNHDAAELHGGDVA